jgi:molecular chaperone GrpE
MNETEEIQDNVEEVTEDNSNLDKVTQELDDVTDRYKRILAEFENYKKRSSKERETLYSSLVSDITTFLLPVLDNLEHAYSAETSDEKYKEGITLVLKQFTDVLKNFGVTEIIAEGEQFSPAYHEAVSSIEDSTLPANTIKTVLRKGYICNDKVIRHSMVVVIK